MNECCGNCKHFRRMYVPPIEAYKDMPTDGFVCGVSVDGDEYCVMWLGRGEEATRGMCEVFSGREE